MNARFVGSAPLAGPLGDAPLRSRGPSPKRRVQSSRCAVAVVGVRGGTAPRQGPSGGHAECGHGGLPTICQRC